MQVLYLDDLVVSSSAILPEITPRIRLTLVCDNRFTQELRGIEGAPRILRRCILKVEVRKTLLYGGVDMDS